MVTLRKPLKNNDLLVMVTGLSGVQFGLARSVIIRVINKIRGRPCLVPRRLSFDENVGGKVTTAVCTLPMVPCGSSPVTRVSRSPLPCEKRSA